jgi:hypothetical protein
MANAIYQDQFSSETTVRGNFEWVYDRQQRCEGADEQ